LYFLFKIGIGHGHQHAQKFVKIQEIWSNQYWSYW